nr:DNA cytosine methyltransferase [Gemmatimonadaceae bacterium]
MIFGSVCSGIEAASAAWHPLGWKAAFVSEIDAFPRAVLAHHYPDVPLHGDFTTIQDGQYAAIDVLVGGTPCQSFSVAGLRGGLADDRGNLALEYLRLAQRLRPKWLVWENVPGVLSSAGGRDFGSILGGLGELGYGFAYRVLDAQYVRVDGFGRAVPQRRRRVFVVGHLGDWRRAAAVLFERESLQGHSPPRRQAGQNAAPTLAARTKGGGGLGTDFDCDGGLIAHTLNAAGGVGRLDYETETFVPVYGGTVDVAHALRADGFDASEDGTGRGTPLVPIAFTAKDHGGDAMSDLSPTLRAGGFTTSHANAGAIAFNSCSQKAAALLGWRIRRLTPTECERLQGFPSGYTNVPYRGKAAADGPRYKALGNSMAVNVMRWIGTRVQLV